MNNALAGNPFSAEGQWYRGSVHNHTNASDGKHSVVELCTWYQDHGIDFAVMTDHDVVADISGTEDLDITVIPGVEIGVCWDETYAAEVLALGIEKVKRIRATPQETINDVLEQGGLPYISHPYLSGVYSGLMMDLDGLVGIETYNVIARDIWDRGRSTVHQDDLVAAGKIVWGLAVDDRHAIDGIGPQAWIEVRAESNEQNTLLEAMRQGFYYSTNGPKIEDITFSETHLTLKCSGAQRVTFSTLPWLSFKRDADSDGSITEVSIELESLSQNRLDTFIEKRIEEGFITNPKNLTSHVRIEIEDGSGGWASTNPIRIKQ